jgi:hypothetical protein
VLPVTGYTRFHVATISKFWGVKIFVSAGNRCQSLGEDKIAISAGSFVTKVYAMYRGADKSLARPTSRCILFDGENTSFDAGLVIYIYIYIYILLKYSSNYDNK